MWPDRDASDIRAAALGLRVTRVSEAAEAGKDPGRQCFLVRNLTQNSAENHACTPQNAGPAAASRRHPQASGSPATGLSRKGVRRGPQPAPLARWQPACSRQSRQHGGRADPASRLPKPEGKGTAGGVWHRFKGEAEETANCERLPPHRQVRGQWPPPSPGPSQDDGKMPTSGRWGPEGSTCHPDLAGAGAGQGGGAPREEVASRDCPRHWRCTTGACGGLRGTGKG